MKRWIFVSCLLLLPQLATGQTLSSTFKKVNPSVVEIETVGREVARRSGARLVTVEGLGSGVLISDKGLVMTAAHVVQAADEITVRFLSGEEIQAQVLASEPGADVALIQLQEMPEDVHVAVLGDSDQAEVGESIFVIGAPLGVSHTLTVGHISARRDSNAVAGSMLSPELLQTDAAINQGNSGGPMFNMKGEVIGIVSHIMSRSGGSEGLGFAVSSNAARRLLMESRGFWSGLEGYELRGTLAQVFNLPQEAGVLVQRVARDSPAARLGLRGGTMRMELEGQALHVGGDIILSVMGIPITADESSAMKIRDKVRSLEDLDKMTVKVLRGGRIVSLEEDFMYVYRPPEPVE